MQDIDAIETILDVATLGTALSAAMTLEPGDIIASGTLPASATRGRGRFS